MSIAEILTLSAVIIVFMFVWISLFRASARGGD
jgi:hypothetical protein